MTFDCAACASDLTATCGGTLTLYTNTTCTTGPAPFLVDGVCRAAGAIVGTAHVAYRHAGSVATASCGVPGPPALPANLALVGERTICCAP